MNKDEIPAPVPAVAAVANLPVSKNSHRDVVGNNDIDKTTEVPPPLLRRQQTSYGSIHPYGNDTTKVRVPLNCGQNKNNDLNYGNRTNDCNNNSSSSSSSSSSSNAYNGEHKRTRDRMEDNNQSHHQLSKQIVGVPHAAASSSSSSSSSSDIHKDGNSNNHKHSSVSNNGTKTNQKQLSLGFPKQPPIELPEDDERTWKRSRTSSSSGGALKRSKTTNGSSNSSYQLSKSKSFTVSRSSLPSHEMPLQNRLSLPLQPSSKSSGKAPGNEGQQPPQPEPTHHPRSSTHGTNNHSAKIQPKYQEVVRKKAEREALRGFQCTECKSYYEG